MPVEQTWVLVHFTLQPGAEHTQDVPASFNAFAYVISGEADFGGGSRARAYAVTGDPLESEPDCVYIPQT